MFAGCCEFLVFDAELFCQQSWEHEKGLTSSFSDHKVRLSYSDYSFAGGKYADIYKIAASPVKLGTYLVSHFAPDCRIEDEYFTNTQCLCWIFNGEVDCTRCIQNRVDLIGLFMMPAVVWYTWYSWMQVEWWMLRLFHCMEILHGLEWRNMWVPLLTARIPEVSCSTRSSSVQAVMSDLHRSFGLRFSRWICGEHSKLGHDLSAVQTPSVKDLKLGS